MEIYLCPAWLTDWLERRGLEDPRKRLHAGYFLSNLLVVAILPLWHWVPHFCLLRTLTGIACPGCGVTHALLLATHLRVYDSFTANPAGCFLAATIGFQIVGRPWAMMDDSASRLVSCASRWMGALAVYALFAVWISKLLKLAI